MSASSFVDVRHVYVDYSPPSGMLAKLSGKVVPAKSVLRDVTFQLAADQHVVVFGAPSAGKSTLLRTLAGVLAPARGHVIINGKRPQETPDLASGYVSSEESEPKKDTVMQVLHAFASTHKVKSIPARVGTVAQILDIDGLLERPVSSLSTTERLKVNIARAALGSSPLVLFDDVTDYLGSEEVSRILSRLFSGRAVIVATRSAQEAQDLELPILLLHKGEMAHFGTCNDIATSAGCSRVVHVWLEGIRYDLLRSIKRQPGVTEVRLMPTDQFEGQQLRIVVKSSRYLPALYDVVSQAPLIRIEEQSANLKEILSSL